MQNCFSFHAMRLSIFAACLIFLPLSNLHAQELIFNSGKGNADFHGRIQVDTALFDPDTRNIENRTDIRRMFLGVKGKLNEDWGYHLMGNFANLTGGSNYPSIQEAWISYHGIDKLTLKLGNQVEPFSFEQQVGNLDQSFVERSIVHDAFHPVRNFGLSAQYVTDDWVVKAGGYAGNINNFDDESDRGYSLTGRVHTAPVKEKHKALHLGVSVRYAAPGAGDNFRYNARPGTRLADRHQFANVNLAGADSAITYGAEAYYIYKNYAFGGEYMAVSNDSTASGDPDFNGWYVQASWFPTGENRDYDYKNGNLKRVVPHKPISKKGFGAVELATRYAALDLDDGTIQGGRLNTLDLALNWHPEKNIKFSANYIISRTDNTGPVPGDNTNALIFRAQYDF